jgi:ABC-type antimicrobial peptide transport system permease subunit
VLGRFLSPILAGVDPLDGPALAISAAGILLLAGAAAYGPARRAMTADPLHSLRAE